jgi:hypothetical protein
LGKCICQFPAPTPNTRLSLIISVVLFHNKILVWIVLPLKRFGNLSLFKNVIIETTRNDKEISNLVIFELLELFVLKISLNKMTIREKIMSPIITALVCKIQINNKIKKERISEKYFHCFENLIR